MWIFVKKCVCWSGVSPCKAGCHLDYVCMCTSAFIIFYHRLHIFALTYTIHAWQFLQQSHVTLRSSDKCDINISDILCHLSPKWDSADFESLWMDGWLGLYGSFNMTTLEGFVNIFVSWYHRFYCTFKATFHEQVLSEGSLNPVKLTW